ncbi:MAG: prepilin-type N-terminal cleavage/methylation domain-containing protein [Phycisphaera sp.]|nr:prepilin-type N-terminal cleavage/methylation domain-containing protein [Phycisphaera sp.]
MHTQTHHAITAPTRRHDNRGFTIVELLVVLSIIVLLLSILLPSMRQARETARRAVCAANLHQTGMAHIAWATDHSTRLVEGQPAFAPGNASGQGQYAVWWRGWNSPRKNEYGGPYTKHGALAATGYHASPQAFYCPSWRNPWTQFETSGASFIPGYSGGGFWRDPSKADPAQTWMQTSYHYNSQFGSPDYDVEADWRGARLNVDPGTAALMADAFSDPKGASWIADGGRGVDQHHVTGYNVLYLDTHVAFVDDPTHYVRDLNGGNTYHAGAANYRTYQSRAWRFFEGRD